MKTPSHASIKKTLKALAPTPLLTPQRHTVSKSRGAMKQFLADHLAGSTTDQERFEKILKADEAELNRVLAKRKAQALKSLRGTDRIFSNYSKAWRGAVDQRASLTGTVASPTYDLLDKPLLIIPSRGLRNVDSQVAPFNSFAKFSFATSESSRNEEVSFFYLWSSASEKFAVINIDTFMIFKGFCTAGVGGGFWPGDRRADLKVDATLTPLEWWNNPPTSPPTQAGASQNVLSLYLSAGGFAEVGALDSATLFRGHNLSHSLFLAPPYGVVIVKVSVNIACVNGDGSGNSAVDFASGDFNVGSPFLLITTLT